ncbi:MAG: NADH-quinone oxidoreductase subunit L, partial [Myxococcota bacterium]|nr:NADH-quinone oxidoreductase subunit L [Myxococcota bacterium]
MTTAQLALASTLAPLFAFAVAAIGFRRRHAIAAGIVLLGGLTTACATVALLLGGPPEVPTIQTAWFTVGATPLEFGYLLDGRTLLMGAIVGVITFCIQVYSLGYMADDPGKGRFFAFLALFEWAMLSFVYAPNLLQSFIFWELVGLASFLLIGFWYHKPSAVSAAKKAFLMTRVGDVGLFIGLILLFQQSGTLDILTITGAFAGEGLPFGLEAARLELIAGLIFMGIVGKSAQFPLHTWLPDAMEGPTPVSALLHSATMVAAGVFLFARFHEVFMATEIVVTVVLAIATFTAILSSTMAMVAHDMKKVLAFSSISQLGFMLMGLAAGSLFAGMFHLTTHAVFKALLFLCAGAFIHHAGTGDLVAIGRSEGRKHTIPLAGLWLGGLALAGIPPLAGFWSKDLILHGLHGPGQTIFLVGAFVASFLTAYYTVRMICLIQWPNASSGAEVVQPADHDYHDHEHHGDGPMNLPIAFLSLGAIAVGAAGGAIADLLGITDVPSLGLADYAPAVLVALGGAGLAWAEYGRGGAKQTGFMTRFPGLRALMVARWKVDVLYQKTFVALALAVARASFTAETQML